MGGWVGWGGVGWAEVGAHMKPWMACLYQGAMMRAEPAAAIASYLRPPAATSVVPVPGAVPGAGDCRRSRAWAGRQGQSSTSTAGRWCCARLLR